MSGKAGQVSPGHLAVSWVVRLRERDEGDRISEILCLDMTSTPEHIR